MEGLLYSTTKWVGDASIYNILPTESTLITALSNSLARDGIIILRAIKFPHSSACSAAKPSRYYEQYV